MDASQALAELWSNAALPASSLSSIRLTGRDSLPSSFRVGALAQATLGAAALAASQVFALRTGEPLGKVTVSAEDAAAEFRSEQLGTLDGRVRFDCFPLVLFTSLTASAVPAGRKSLG